MATTLILWSIRSRDDGLVQKAVYRAYRTEFEAHPMTIVDGKIVAASTEFLLGRSDTDAALMDVSPQPAKFREDEDDLVLLQFAKMLLQCASRIEAGEAVADVIRSSRRCEGE
jgi:hypothetical protein